MFSYSCAHPKLVPVRRQIWPPSAILKILWNRISFLTRGGISSHICIWIPLQFVDHLRNRNFPFIYYYNNRIAPPTPLFRCFKICLGYFPKGLVVHVLIQFRSVDKYGRHRPPRTSSESSGGILSKLCISIPLSPLMRLP